MFPPDICEELKGSKGTESHTIYVVGQAGCVEYNTTMIKRLKSIEIIVYPACITSIQTPTKK